MTTSAPHIVIIGSGMGGATMALALAPTGVRITVLERGSHLSPSQEARDDRAIFRDGFFRPEETWRDETGTAFNPGNYYYVGGNSKFYGGVLTRYRREDFAALQHLGGISPAWPYDYDTLELWYQLAETLYEVRGDASQDPTEPSHSGSYVYGPVADEPDIFFLRQKLERSGARPFSLPLGIDIEKWLADGQTPWDAFPNTGEGKKDADSVALKQALAHENVSLITEAFVSKIHTTDGKVTHLDVLVKGQPETIPASHVVLAAGAVNSAALLLRSASHDTPTGLANGSDCVGRYFMNHNCSALLALAPWRRNRAVYQKTLGVNDYYLTGGPNGAPLGNIQLLGKISGTILKSNAPRLPQLLADWIADHSYDWYVMSEDLPNPDSRVTLTDQGHIRLVWQRTNWQTHEHLVRKTRQLLGRAGFPIIVSRPFDRRTPSHQCGTARMGLDPAHSVVDVFGRSHEVPNLFIVDASVLPTSAAVNPALTIAAHALRAADHMKQKDLAA